MFRLAAALPTLLVAGPIHAVTLDLNVDLVGVTETTATRSAGAFGTDWEQTSSGGFFPTFSLSATAEHFIEVAIPWSTNNWSDFTQPQKDPAPVVYRFEAFPDPSSSTLVPFANTFIDLLFLATAGPQGPEGAQLTVIPDSTALFVVGVGGGGVEFWDLSDALPYDVVDFVIRRSFSVAEPDGSGGFFFLVSTATEAVYVFQDGELIRIEATRGGQLTQLFFEGNVLSSVMTVEGPLSDGDFVRDRSGLRFEVGQPIPEVGVPAALAAGLPTLAALVRRRRRGLLRRLH